MPVEIPDPSVPQEPALPTGVDGGLRASLGGGGPKLNMPGVDKILKKFFAALLGLLDLNGDGQVDVGDLNPLTWLSRVMSLGWAKYDKNIADVGELQDVTLDLGKNVSFGQLFMPSSMGEWWPGTWYKRVPFTQQNGPMVGVTHDGQGTFTLGSKGLWTAQAQVFFSWSKVNDPRIFMDIVLFRPDGTEFERRKVVRKTLSDNVFEGSGTTQETVTNVYDFTVPGPGWKVQVEAYTANNDRAIIPGKAYTGFSVKKLYYDPSPVVLPPPEGA